MVVGPSTMYDRCCASFCMSHDPRQAGCLPKGELVEISDVLRGTAVLRRILLFTLQVTRHKNSTGPMQDTAKRNKPPRSSTDHRHMPQNSTKQRFQQNALRVPINFQISHFHFHFHFHFTVTQTALPGPGPLNICQISQSFLNEILYEIFNFVLGRPNKLR